MLVHIFLLQGDLTQFIDQGGNYWLVLVGRKLRIWGKKCRRQAERAPLG